MVSTVRLSWILSMLFLPKLLKKIYLHINVYDQIYVCKIGYIKTIFKKTFLGEAWMSLLFFKVVGGGIKFPHKNVY